MNNKLVAIVFIVLCIMTGAAWHMKKNKNFASQPNIEAPAPPLVAPAPPVNPPVDPKPVAPPKSFAEALEQAKTLEKKIFVYFTMNGCGPCITFKNNLNGNDVKKALQNYIVYHVKLEEEPDVFEDYKVRSTPSYFVIDSSGQTLKSGKGNKSGSEFIKWLGNL